MESPFAIGFDIVFWLQDTFPGLDSFMAFFSDLGSFEVYLAVVLWLYWCQNKVVGRRLAYLLAFTTVAVNVSKHFFRSPRPYWTISGNEDSATSGYGFPSGHATTATVTFIYLISVVRKNWFTILGVLWIALMMISRIYLGQHFPLDVLGGLFLGLIILSVFVFWRRYMADSFKQRILGQRFWFVLLVPLIIFVIYIVVINLLPMPSYAVNLSASATQAELFSWEDVVFAVAALMGLGVGFELEGRDVRFLVDGSTVVKILRFVIGLTAELVILYGSGEFFGSWITLEENFYLYLVVRFLRYFFVSLFAVYFLPMIYVRVGMMTAEPKPEIKASMNLVNPSKSDSKSEFGQGGF